MSTILKKHTTKCPTCKNRLWFELIGSIRIVRNYMYNFKCPTCNTFGKVWADNAPRKIIKDHE